MMNYRTVDTENGVIKSGTGHQNVVGFELYLLKQFANPFRLSWNLIRLGHEPLSPVQFYSPLALFGWSAPSYVYPNIFSYVYHTVRTYGLWKVISTGVFASASLDFASEIFHRAFQRRSVVWQCWLDDTPPLDDGGLRHVQSDDSISELPVPVTRPNAFHIETQMEEAPVRLFMRMLGEAMSLKTWEVVTTQPFVVVVLRQVAALVGGEPQYSWFPLAVRSVYRESGLTGFFQGLIPRLVGELFVVAVYYSTCRLFRQLLWGLKSRRSPSLRVAQVLVYFGLRNYVYPLELTGCIWTVRKSHLAMAAEANSFAGWRDLHKYLISSGQASRGWLPVFRTHVQSKHLPK